MHLHLLFAWLSTLSPMSFISSSGLEHFLNTQTLSLKLALHDVALNAAINDPWPNGSFSALNCTVCTISLHSIFSTSNSKSSTGATSGLITFPSLNIFDKEMLRTISFSFHFTSVTVDDDECPCCGFCWLMKREFAFCFFEWTRSLNFPVDSCKYSDLSTPQS